MSQIYSLLPIGDELFKFFNPKSAIVFYKNKKRDLLNGNEEVLSLEEIQKHFEEVQLSKNYENGRLIHFFYEWGYFYHDLEELICDEDIIAIDIEYQSQEKFISSEIIGKGELEKIDFPTYEDYELKFKRGYEYLLNGDCYQFNLTFPYLFNTSKIEDLISLCEASLMDNHKRGEFAHFTFLNPLKRAFLSNSPECLFSIEINNEKLILESKPIKGSLPLEKESDWKKEWEKMLQSKKDETELNIITDLIRNDLSKIQDPIAKVIENRSPLIVPKILHQFSRIQVSLDKTISLAEIMKAMFPGGSITGAPKKRVLKILRELEDRQRGFYCGSTVFLFKDTKSSSINIRSCDIDIEKSLMNYQAGGGITLLSEARLEYDEMELKVSSFIKPFFE